MSSPALPRVSFYWTIKQIDIRWSQSEYKIGSQMIMNNWQTRSWWLEYLCIFSRRSFTHCPCMNNCDSSSLDHRLIISYLKPTQFEMQFLFLIQQLLQPVRQYNVGIVEPAVFFVELVVLVDLLIDGASLADSLNSKVLQIMNILTLKRSTGPALIVLLHTHLGILVKPGVMRGHRPH